MLEGIVAYFFFLLFVKSSFSKVNPPSLGKAQSSWQFFMSDYFEVSFVRHLYFFLYEGSVKLGVDYRSNQHVKKSSISFNRA
jgi:hypothetical protein